jgi:imidazolonepropionase-like amidohydrolase
VAEGNGRTLMSGLCDAHTHFSWNHSADLDGLGTMPVEEHLLFAVESARSYLDSGYTMCLGAASAKDRLDVVCRDAINVGRIPGPRYLANGPEIAVTGGELVKGITWFADGPDEMRKAVPS